MSEQPTERQPRVQAPVSTEGRELGWEDRWFIFALRLALLLGVVGVELILILAVARLLLR